MRRLKGLNSAAITRGEATTARVDFSPVRATNSRCNRTTAPKYTAASIGHAQDPSVGVEGWIVGSDAECGHLKTLADHT
jgi:hypothetical protein